MASKQQRIYNEKLAFQTLKESVACICECGHTDSEHYVGKKLEAIHCAECECPRFRQAYKIKRIPEGK